MVKFKGKNKNAFTLIELLIVIAVIAVLVAILVPNFKSMRMEAKESRAKGDLKNLQTAVIIYVNRNGVFPASGANTPSLSILLNEPKEYRSLNEIPVDPFDTQKRKYRFMTEGIDGTNGDISSDAYYIIYSVGRDETAADDITGPDDMRTSLNSVSDNDSAINLGSGVNKDDIYVTNAKTP